MMLDEDIRRKAGENGDFSQPKAGDRMSKKEVRQKSLRLRDSLTESERISYSREIIRTLTSLACYQEAKVILAYVNYRSEVMTLDLIRQAITEKRLVFVPKVTGCEMEFYQITDLRELHKGYKGIPEPEAGRSFPDYLARTPGDFHTLLCMPGAAFDRFRHRIGYGGGFYDRYLEKLFVYQTQDGLLLTTAALAYTCQMHHEIPWEPHDVIPDILLTEQGII